MKFYERIQLHLKEGDAPTWVIISVCALLAIGAITMAIIAITYDFAYRGRIFPGVHVENIALGGLSPAHAQEMLDKEYRARLPDYLRFTFRQQDISLPVRASASESSATNTDLVDFLVQERIRDAYETGRSGFILTDLFTRLRARSSAVTLEAPELALDTDLLRQRVSTALDRLVSNPQEPQIRVSIVPTSTEPLIVISEPTPGESYDVSALETLVRETILHADSSSSVSMIAVPTIVTESRFTRDQALPLTKDIAKHLGRSPFRLTAERRDWTFSSSTRAEWYMLAVSGTELVLTLDVEKLREDIEPSLKPFLRDPVDGYLELDANASSTKKLKSFKPPVEGVGYDINELRDTILAYYQQPTSSTSIQVPLKKIAPKIEGSDAQTLGIREALGTGRSNFSGSPANRRHNIRLGKERVHGTLIPPGEEFSMLKTLGPVDGRHGWLPELVIKGNKTTPEYGGGLCQIGTTAFRTALEGGMPITERRNHSYRVRYYEPAGTDATIYEPAPDFKFRNDSANWILITGELVGDEVSFTLWGTDDGRISSYTKPKIYNIISPPPMKIVETTELAPGKMKCTESAHAGADASFDYKVIYPNGEVKDQNFFSRYRPWQAVCLKGVAQITQPEVGIDQTGINNPN